MTTPAKNPAVVVEDHGAVRVLRLHRPERRNALSREMVDALFKALDDIDAAFPTCRAVVIAASGDRAFCAGADLKERADMSEPEVRAFVARLQALMNTIEALRVPVLAAIQGAALGGGLELALACDLRYAARSATLGLPEVRLGIIPGAGGTQRLPRTIGAARARELIFTARRLDGAAAAAIGLVHEVVDDDALEARVHEVAHEIAQAAPVAIAQAKYAIAHGSEVDLATGLAIERKAYEVTLPTQDRREALAAFAEKRPPRFVGR
jgi:methylglutaconyl-CoA hydratase